MRHKLRHQVLNSSSASDAVWCGWEVLDI